MFVSNVSFNIIANSSCMPRRVQWLISVTFQNTLRQKIGKKWVTTGGYSQKLSYKWEESLLCKLYQSQSEPSLCNICTRTQPWYRQGVPTGFKEFSKRVYSSLNSEQQTNSYDNKIIQFADYLSLEHNLSVNFHTNSLLRADDITPSLRLTIYSIMVIFEMFWLNLCK